MTSNRVQSNAERAHHLLRISYSSRHSIQVVEHVYDGMAPRRMGSFTRTVAVVIVVLCWEVYVQYDNIFENFQSGCCCFDDRFWP